VPYLAIGNYLLLITVERQPEPMSKSLNERRSVCIPSGIDPRSYSCIRSLSPRGIHTIHASNETYAMTGASRFCDERIQIPSPNTDLLAYRDSLIEIAARPDVQTIIPVRPHDAYLFATYYDMFNEHISLTVPSSDLYSIITDRIQLAEAAKKAGVTVPKTRLLTNVDDWTPELIVKSRHNLLTKSSIGDYEPNQAKIVDTVKHLEPGEKPDIDQVIQEMEHVPIVQEYIRSSDEYVFGALYDHGDPLATFQHRQIRGDSYTGGGGVYREAVSIPELETAGRELLESIDYNGLACIEFMKDTDTGEFVLTEINPRMWQSLPCAIHATVDFPYYYWLLTQGAAHEIDHEYDVGVGSHKLYGEIGYLISIMQENSPLVDRPSIAAELRAVLQSCYETPHFDMLRVDDPVPFVSGLAYILKEKL